MGYPSGEMIEAQGSGPKRNFSGSSSLLLGT